MLYGFIKLLLTVFNIEQNYLHRIIYPFCVGLRISKMLAIAGLIASFILIFFLRAKRVDFSLSLMGASVLIGLTSKQPSTILWSVAVKTFMDGDTWVLILAVSLISILGYSLKKTGLMIELIENLRGILSSRILLTFIPAIFGLLAMPGGALMSAPFNEPEAERLNLKAEHKTYINVWFRHVWYWASPISSTTILAVSIAGFTIKDFVYANLPLFFAMWIIGYLIILNFIKKSGGNGGGKKRYLESLKYSSPILATVLFTISGVPVYLALLTGIGLVFLLKKVRGRGILEIFFNGVRPDIVGAVVAMLYFRYMILSSGSVNSLFEIVMGAGVPIMVLMVIIPLLVGTISGTPTMGIGIVLPILLPLIVNPNIHTLSIILAGIVAGYTGSPLHLCLILTNKYYKSTLKKVYPYLIPSTVALYMVALVYHLFFSTPLW
jgi:hypothetical protein